MLRLRLMRQVYPWTPTRTLGPRRQTSRAPSRPMQGMWRPRQAPAFAAPASVIRDSTRIPVQWALSWTVVPDAPVNAPGCPYTGRYTWCRYHHTDRHPKPAHSQPGPLTAMADFGAFRAKVRHPKRRPFSQPCVLAEGGAVHMHPPSSIVYTTNCTGKCVHRHFPCLTRV